MKLNDYGDLIESWKLELIKCRALKLGLRRDLLEDAQQEIVPVLLKFEYNPENANRASEATVLTAVIDRRLKHLIRTESRYLARQRDAAQLASREIRANNSPLSIDIRNIVNSMPERDRSVLQALASGASRSDIARDLDCDWHTVNLVIERAQERFMDMGFRA